MWELGMLRREAEELLEDLLPIPAQEREASAEEEGMHDEEEGGVMLPIRQK